MKKIVSALSDIYQKTGIECSLYSAFGESLYSAVTPAVPFALPAPSRFEDNVAQERGVTYLCVHRMTGIYYVAIKGDDREARNYAFMLDAVLGSTEERLRDDFSTEEKLRLILSGELSSVQKNMFRAHFSDVRFSHYMMSLVTRTREMQAELKHFLSMIADKRDYIVTMDERTLVYLRVTDDDNGEYHSAYEFASILYENVKEELRIDLTISTGGTIRSFQELSGSYEKVIFTYKFGKLLSPAANVYSYNDYILIRILSDTPKSLLIKYFDSLLEKNGSEVLADSELMNTAEEFMKNSLNISETSRNMYIHRNTLIYRLDKIEKETGLNLRVFGDAVTFNLLQILNTLIKGE